MSGLKLSELFEQSMSFLKSGKFQKLERSASKMKSIDSQSGDAYHFLGLAKFHTNRYRESIKFLEKACELQPSNADIHNNIGNCYKELAEFKLAEKSYKDAISLDRGFHEAYQNLALVLVSQGRWSEAEEAAKDAVSINPASVDGYNNLGVVYTELGDYVAAAEVLEKALRFNSSHSGALYNLGKCRELLKDYDAAIDAYQKVILLNPKFSLAYNNLANLLVKRGNFESAEAMFNKALHCGVGVCSEAIYNLGNLKKALYGEKLARKFFLSNRVKKHLLPHVTIQLAIYAYLDLDMESVCKYLENIDSRNLSGIDFKFVDGYKSYLDLLNTWHKERASSNTLMKDENTYSKDLYCIGESHCLSPSGLQVQLSGGSYNICSKIVMGCKSWHLASSFDNPHKRELENHLKSIPDSSFVVFMFGEIDCRLDEGILPVYREAMELVDKAIEAHVRDYVEYIERLSKEHKVIPIYYGVPALNNNYFNANSSDEASLRKIIRLYNEYLGRYVSEKEREIIDVYKMTNIDRGMSDGKFHIDRVHLLPSAVASCISENLSI